MHQDFTFFNLGEARAANENFDIFIVLFFMVHCLTLRTAIFDPFFDPYLQIFSLKILSY